MKHYLLLHMDGTWSHAYGVNEQDAIEAFFQDNEIKDDPNKRVYLIFLDPADKRIEN